tara:strand:+ start:10192 stop:10461 length:270 start_codon:yes stop_codon:yes gene_type:complete
MNQSLEALRGCIDEVDTKINALLNERARIVTELGALKQKEGQPVFQQERHQEVIARMKAMSLGDLPEEHLEAIYEQILKSSVALQAFSA